MGRESHVGLLSPLVHVPSQKTEPVTERGVPAAAEWGRVGVSGGKLAKLGMLMRDFCSERCKEGFIMLGVCNKPA